MPNEKCMTKQYKPRIFQLSQRLRLKLSEKSLGKSEFSPRFFPAVPRNPFYHEARALAVRDARLFLAVPSVAAAFCDRSPSHQRQRPGWAWVLGAAAARGTPAAAELRKKRGGTKNEEEDTGKTKDREQGQVAKKFFATLFTSLEETPEKKIKPSEKVTYVQLTVVFRSKCSILLCILLEAFQDELGTQLILRAILLTAASLALLFTRTYAMHSSPNLIFTR